jgi:hypothetical protein
MKKSEEIVRDFLGLRDQCLHYENFIKRKEIEKGRELI